MPEYLAPGVYVEETSFRAKAIEGVGTTTTGFIGPTRYGPIDIEPDILTSLTDFETTYGDRQPLQCADAADLVNYMWHAARAFFEEGGKRLYVARVFQPTDPTDRLSGHARGRFGLGDGALQLWARFPGQVMNNARVTLTLNLGQNAFSVDRNGVRQLQGMLDRDVVYVRAPAAAPPASIPTGYYLLLWDSANQTWRFGQTGQTAATAAEELQANFAAGFEVRAVTADVGVQTADPTSPNFTAVGLPLDPAHQRAGAPDSLFAYFAPNPASLTRARTLPITIGPALDTDDGLSVLNRLFLADPVAFSPPLGSPPLSLRDELSNPSSPRALRSMVATLTGGDDGRRPPEIVYEGSIGPDDGSTPNPPRGKTGLKNFEDLEDISIVAAPGATFGLSGGWADQAHAITSLMITHATLMRYRIAVLDCGDGQSPSEVRAFRGLFDSTYAALYYPWVRILDPVTQTEIAVPPSGFVAGIYVRNDIDRAVYKAPANEVVNLALGFETFLNKSQQEVLNPEGINCFRYFEGRGMRLWGARTISSDPEWKYVNLRRYFAYLERSIDLGTQWAVFEPNGPLLWDEMRHAVSEFLLTEWHNGALLGDTPELAFFVKCDRSTMTQNDLDNGRLVCLVGVAALRPAEFVIIRIGQWTADRS